MFQQYNNLDKINEIKTILNKFHSPTIGVSGKWNECINVNRNISLPLKCCEHNINRGHVTCQLLTGVMFSWTSTRPENVTPNLFSTNNHSISHPVVNTELYCSLLTYIQGIFVKIRHTVLMFCINVYVLRNISTKNVSSF